MKWLSKLKVEDLFPTEYGLMDSFGLNRIFKLIIRLSAPDLGINLPIPFA